MKDDSSHGSSVIYNTNEEQPLLPPNTIKGKIVMYLPRFYAIKKILNFVDVLELATCTASLTALTTGAPLSR